MAIYTIVAALDNNPDLSDKAVLTYLAYVPGLSGKVIAGHVDILELEGIHPQFTVVVLRHKDSEFHCNDLTVIIEGCEVSDKDDLRKNIHSLFMCLFENQLVSPTAECETVVDKNDNLAAVIFKNNIDGVANMVADTYREQFTLQSMETR